jgi:subtilisin family serine protease
MWINEEEANGLPGVDDDFNGIIDDFNGFYDVKTSKTNTPTDKNGHGTHISGIIGMSHNGIGGRGVMDKVKIMPLKIKIDTDYSYPMDVTLRAIDYAIKKKVTILTTSIGDYENSKAFEEAIRNVIKNNIPFVCACGNSNDNLDRKKVYPPSYVETIPEIIVVCDHGPSGKKDYLSNYGKKTVTIMAPGTQIYSSYVTLKEVSPGRKGPDYSMESGSSMAAPFVTGAIGLLLSNEPNLTPAEIKERIVKTAKKENQLKGYSQSGGRLDIYRLLQNIEN